MAWTSKDKSATHSAHSARATIGHSASGSMVKPCHECTRYTRDKKACIANGLRIIRIRFGIPQSELPDLNEDRLSMYLLFLLGQGKARASVPFPRRQRPGENGLCNLQRLCRRDRWSFAHSVNSLKRNLPAGCRRHKPSHADSFQQNQCPSFPPLSSPEYLRFCRTEVRRIFPYGWDREYANFVMAFVPKPSAREVRLSRADLLWRGRRKEFLRGALGGRISDDPFTGRYKEVLSAGKVRPLSLFEERVDLLGPLHKVLYKHLSKQDWLLKGPPTVEKIKSVCAGHTWYTSVDLVSATDNLPLDAAEAILGALLAKCSVVPGGVRAFACQSLRPLVSVHGQRHEVTHGQMMGAYLSFPLLCLQSYIAARWATRDTEASFLVNGDDTLIATDHAVDGTAYPPGFKLNELKTIRAENVAEINSTLFLKEGKGKWTQVVHLRRGGACADYDGMLHMASAVSGSVAWTSAFVRSRIGARWGFLPSQLGLHPMSYPAFQRQYGMRRVHTDLPDLSPVVPDDGTIMVRGIPDEDEKAALRVLQWEQGRATAGPRPQPPSHGKLRKTFRYSKGKNLPRGCRFQPKLTYLCHLASLRVTKRRRKEDVYAVPASYTSIREVEAIRRLDEFRVQINCA